MKTARYRIKIVTFKSGRSIYYPSVKKWWGWSGLGHEGTETGLCYIDYSTREWALRLIDLHYKGGSNVHLVQFEYINK